MWSILGALALGAAAILVGFVILLVVAMRGVDFDSPDQY